ncbi:MAG: biopolymer transporter ExbD [Methylocystaceae bacterium]|nr:biopolymer transporter ExbD [Methylocystaceae bacterium]
MPTLSNSLKTKRRRIPISLTPLIDVVFILLVFFMLASSFEKHRSVELVPPKESKGKSTQPKTDQIILLLVGNDRFEVNDQTYDLDAIHTFLDERRDQKILIKTGPDASLQDLVSLLDLTASLSLPNIALLPFREQSDEKP